MADITMCEGKDCNMKETCYRFKAIACEYYQAYFSEAPHDNKKDEDGNTECEYYWETVSEEEVMEYLDDNLKSQNETTD